jgi:hypothetical protein
MTAPPAEEPRTRTYIQVIAVEILVITALFFLGRYFG